MKLFGRNKKNSHEKTGPASTEQHTEEQNSVSRRQFVTGVAGAAGAGLMLGKSALPAWADGSAPLDKPVSPWPAEFNPQGTAPQYNPREMPKAGEVIHKFEMEVTIGIHEIVPGIKAHMFLFNGSYPGPVI
ncbi:MAG: hypothetical protein M3Y13_02345, partial [Armatimonadota bacterium]|nr:hypothetical protein [Armatimonadota bacterium]